MSILEQMQAMFDDWEANYSRGDVEASVVAYTEDGAIYSPYGPAAVGRAAIRETHKEWLAAGEMNKKIEVLDARGEGRLAYCLAAYSGDFEQDDGSIVTESGISLNIALKQADGSWKLYISSLNSDTPPLAEASA